MAKKSNTNVNLTTSTDLKVAVEGEQMLVVICIEIAFLAGKRIEVTLQQG